MADDQDHADNDGLSTGKGPISGLPIMGQLRKRKKGYTIATGQIPFQEQPNGYRTHRYHIRIKKFTFINCLWCKKIRGEKDANN